jgi:integrase
MPRETGQGNSLEGHHEILGGIAHIYQVKKSGEVWQFRMWLSNERKHYRKSLRTRVFRDAMTSAEKLALELRVNIETGKKVFGITVLELFDFYIENREKDIGEGDGTITLGTWKMLKYKIQHGVEMLGHDTKVANVRQADLEDYRQRRTQERSVGVQQILNEQSQLNAMWEFGYKGGHSNFRKLDFKKIKRKSKIEKKRATFTDEQYRKLYTFTGVWSEMNKKSTKDATWETLSPEILKRRMIHDMILILANTGMRIGECRQLRYGHLSDEQTIVNDKTGKKTNLVYITIPALISKTRQEREFFTVGREYFDRLKARQQFTRDTHLIFSMDGNKSLSDKEWGSLWKEIMQGIGIYNHSDEGLTWYSLRHFAITKKIASGIPIIDLSKIVGTAVDNIEKVYLDYNKEMSRSAALKTFKKNEDGSLSQLSRLEM